MGIKLKGLKTGQVQGRGESQNRMIWNLTLLAFRGFSSYICDKDEPRIKEARPFPFLKRVQIPKTVLSRVKTVSIAKNSASIPVLQETVPGDADAAGVLLKVKDVNFENGVIVAYREAFAVKSKLISSASLVTSESPNSILRLKE